MIKAVGVWYRHNDSTIGIFRIETFHAEEMDLYLFQGYDCIRFW